jgi:hypothetical protein
MNLQIRNIISLLAEHEASSTSAPSIEEAELNERQARGRSMLRTSDIIEARLSAIAKSKETKNITIEELTNEERARTISPLRRNPVDISTILEQRNRTLSPLQRNPSTSMKCKSRGLSLPTLPHLNPIPHGPASRNESPLRRNPTFPIPSQPIAPTNPSARPDPVSRPNSNFAFNQTLARFQNLAEQSAKDGRQASTEVTQRAIAGIYIPGS